MVPVEPTTWPLDPHSRVKHLILRRHMDAWLPIMTRSFPQLLYIDGFAGPGVYDGGEPGSPVIALRAAAFNGALKARPPNCKLAFLFIEQRADRVERLKAELARLAATTPLPGWTEYDVCPGEFEAVMRASFHRLSCQGRRPMFVFIDPFGYSGLPMSVVRMIASVLHSECLITFAYKSINRWGGDESKHDALDALYGTIAWRDRYGDEAGMVDLYRDQLVRLAGFKYHCAFKMKDRLGVTEYFLAFCTNEPKGLAVMKAAMWKADPRMGRVFSDADDEDQLILDITLDPLRDLLLREFRGRGWVTVEEVVESVRHTHYSEDKHLIRDTLAPMEKEVPKVLQVDRAPNSRKGTFNRVRKLRFF